MNVPPLLEQHLSHLRGNGHEIEVTSEGSGEQARIYLVFKGYPVPPSIWAAQSSTCSSWLKASTRIPKWTCSGSLPSFCYPMGGGPRVVPRTRVTWAGCGNDSAGIRRRGIRRMTTYCRTLSLWTTDCTRGVR